LNEGEWKREKEKAFKGSDQQLRLYLFFCADSGYSVRQAPIKIQFLKQQLTTQPDMRINEEFIVKVAGVSHRFFAEQICLEMEESAKKRGTGIAKRSPEYLIKKMEEGKAVIAFTKDGNWAGFCYIETWSHGKYVANSGLIVAPRFRNSGLAKQIKSKIFELSASKYPNAKIFGLTTGLAVMKINSELGYKPVTYSELTDEEAFWNGCKSCINYEILKSKERKNCLCTAMLFDPSERQKRPALETVKEQKERRFATFLNLLKRVKNKESKKLAPASLHEDQASVNKSGLVPISVSWSFLYKVFRIF
jgi:hypothetical protein